MQADLGPIRELVYTYTVNATPCTGTDTATVTVTEQLHQMQEQTEHLQFAQEQLQATRIIFTN
jgi:hypothetical protein